MALARALALDGLHFARARAHREVALIEALLFHAVGTAHQRQRAAGEMRHDALAHAVVVAREIELGELERRIHDPRRMRDLYAVHCVRGCGGGRRPRRGGFLRRFLRPLLAHRLGGNVFAQPHERRLPQDAVVGALGVSDFANQHGT